MPKGMTPKNRRIKKLTAGLKKFKTLGGGLAKGFMPNLKNKIQGKPMPITSEDMKRIKNRTVPNPRITKEEIAKRKIAIPMRRNIGGAIRSNTKAKR